MKSPITGKEMSLHKEERRITFRKEAFPVVYHYFLCGDSGAQFTSTQLDEINMNQVYNQYRDKHNLPFPDEIKEIREKYGLSAAKMAQILGFGVNSYRNYENGEVPNISNGNLIQLVNDPRKFKDLVKNSDAVSDDAKAKILRKIDHLIREENKNADFEGYLLQGILPDEYSGYKKPSLKRLTEMVVFFAEKLEPWKTQMNKLLFYADFLMFKKTCFSISGGRYRAINMGPVPANYNSVFEYMENKNEVDISAREFRDGGIGEQFKARADRRFNADLFTSVELDVMHEVAGMLKDLTTQDVIERSHKERGWMENKAEKALISYKYAFDLESF